MKRMTTILSLVLVLYLLAEYSPASAVAAEVGSGTCGENITWVLTDDGTLTISGSDPMTDYPLFQNDSPWYPSRR